MWSVNFQFLGKLLLLSLQKKIMVSLSCLSLNLFLSNCWLLVFGFVQGSTVKPRCWTFFSVNYVLLFCSATKSQGFCLAAPSSIIEILGPFYRLISHSAYPVLTPITTWTKSRMLLYPKTMAGKLVATQGCTGIWMKDLKDPYLPILNF